MNFVDFSKLSILVVPGLALWLTTKLAIGVSRDASRRGGPFSLLRWTSILLMTFGCLGFAASFANPIGLLLSPLLLIVLFSFLVFRGRLERETFLNCLLHAHFQAIDTSLLSEALEKDASWLNRGRFRRFRIAQRLGKSFVESFAQTGFGLPASLQLQVGFSHPREGANLRLDDFERPLQEASLIEDRYRSAVREFVETLVYIAWMPSLLAFVHQRLIIMLEEWSAEFPMLDSRTGIVPVSKSFMVQVDWLLYLGPVFAGVSGVIFLVSLLAYSELIPKAFVVSRRLHRRYDQAIVQRSLGLAGKRGYSLRDGLRIIGASHPFRRWRLEAGKILEDSAIDDEGILKRFGEKQLMSPSETGRIAIALKRGDWSEVALRRSNGMLETAIHRWLYAARTMGPLFLITIGLWLGAIAVWLFLKLNDFNTSTGLI